jgi:three-Cys-motif partner protein
MDREKLVPYEGREQAFVKHFLLESYLARLIMITAQVRYSRIAYVDAFAGPWKAASSDLRDTSFAKAIDVMEGCRVQLATQFKRSVTFRALFVERDPVRYAALKQFAEARTTAQIQITAINEDFAESAESVADWIRSDEMALVLIDPTGWKDVIAPRTLAPLLRKRNVELLINVMWNFIQLAAAHANQEANLREIFGDKLGSLTGAAASSGGREWMLAYIDHLNTNSGSSGAAAPLRTAWFPVEFPSKDRVFYFLAYVTHHVKGIIVFLEESERALEYQKEVKFVVKQKQRERDSGITDIFGDTLHSAPSSLSDSEGGVREAWLDRVPEPGSEIVVDEVCIADMAEKCGCLISRLQSELKRLIERGVVENLDAKRARPKNAVNYRNSERIRRLIR